MMMGILGTIFLGGCGFFLGIVIGKTITKDGHQDTGPGHFIAIAMGVFFMCGSIWLGLLNGWI